jgi:hypothetical protein
VPDWDEIDEVLDELEPAAFTTKPTGETIRVAGVEAPLIEFTGHLRRLKTERGRWLVPVEDVIGLLDAQIDADGSLEDTRRFLVSAAMEDSATEGPDA